MLFSIHTLHTLSSAVLNYHQSSHFIPSHPCALESSMCNASFSASPAPCLFWPRPLNTLSSAQVAPFPRDIPFEEELVFLLHLCHFLYSFVAFFNIKIYIANIYSNIYKKYIANLQCNSSWLGYRWLYLSSSLDWEKCEVTVD